ncbi:hypothetical protein Belba_1634 [Belliella baltica DSM 15883]|uniref:Uncharacterized protein n=1 Tax=Belliella baltica (strain DSM 15883 / CIP 108006 / LMG 21964 / BA134) TaxID=866536 RepID=I3Z4S2_BELBD|nr:hypothetical protein Belba_1634 [Belliella baltica DSM 15883]
MKKCLNFIAAFSLLIAFSGINLTFAECPSGAIMNGKCSLSKMCFAAIGYTDCDPTTPQNGQPGTGGGSELPPPPTLEP